MAYRELCYRICSSSSIYFVLILFSFFVVVFFAFLQHFDSLFIVFRFDIQVSHRALCLRPLSSCILESLCSIQMPPRTTPLNIFLFIPNLIGYIRIAFSLVSFYLAQDYPLLFIILYSLSFILDAADGMAARALGQCSNMGVILDMLTDRASTAGALVIVDKALQPAPYMVSFILATLVFLDVSSHFCRMYASLFIKKDTHKDVSDSIFSLLRVYYSNRKFMGILCVGQEFCYVVLFAWASFRHIQPVADILFYVFLGLIIPCFLKQVANVQQLIDGLYHIAEVDANTRSKRN